MSGGGHGGGRGGRRRGGHTEEHENAERWMVTYADMLTLLLVLFIVLYAISSLNVSKFNELKSGLSSAFNGGTAPSVLSAGNGVIPGQAQNPTVVVGPKGPSFSTKSGGGPTAAAKTEADQFAKIRAAIDKSLKAQGLGGSALYTVNEKGLVVSVLTNSVVFAGDSAVLEPGGEHILSAILPSLTGVDNLVEIDGNTNQVQSAVDGWQLSSDRAVRVAHYLMDTGHIAGSRLRGGFNADKVPLVAPSDPRAETLNRRVDIVILSKYSVADRTGLFSPTSGAAKSGTAQSGAAAEPISAK